MILVVLGTQDKQFTRILEAVDKEINISENTKPFYNLLEKNTEIQERLETISKRHFIGVKKPRKKIFLISKKKN